MARPSCPLNWFLRPIQCQEQIRALRQLNECVLDGISLDSAFYRLLLSDAAATCTPPRSLGFLLATTEEDQAAEALAGISLCVLPHPQAARLCRLDNLVSLAELCLETEDADDQEGEESKGTDSHPQPHHLHPPRPACRCVYISSVAVKRDFRNQGLGSWILRSTLAFLGRLGDHVRATPDDGSPITAALHGRDRSGWPPICEVLLHVQVR